MKLTVNHPGVPSTRLFVDVISKNENRLGDNRPVAFILPGGPGADHTAYQGYACLREVVDMVFHDPRGCGQSDKGDASTYNMDNYINDVESIRQQLSLNKITVIGKSYGSMCALGYALRYPQSVDRLVLAAGAPSYRFLETAKKNLKKRGTPEQIAICQKLWAGSFKSREEVLQFFQTTNSLYSIKAKTQKAEFNLAKKSQQFAHEVLNEGFKKVFWHFDYENELQRIACPTLILAGREDWINDVKYAEFMLARIPYSELRVFEGASHAMETDATQEFFQTIADFIS